MKGENLAELKRKGVVDGGMKACRLCGNKGDCRPVPITIWKGVPAICDECYNWFKDNELVDGEKEKELFYPKAMQ